MSEVDVDEAALTDTFVPLRERVEQVEMLGSPEWPPVLSVLVAEFVVVGSPKGAGSKDAVPVVRKDPKNPARWIPILRENGMPVINVKDSSGEEGKRWRQDVSSAGLHWRRFDAPLAGRLALELTFVFPYKQSDYSKREPGKLRGATRVAPHVRPDVLKLARAVEDALSTILYEDDARITNEMIRKVHVAPEDGPERCEVRLWTLPTTWAEMPEQVADTVQETLPVE